MAIVACKDVSEMSMHETKSLKFVGYLMGINSKVSVRRRHIKFFRHSASSTSQVSVARVAQFHIQQWRYTTHFPTTWWWHVPWTEWRHRHRMYTRSHRRWSPPAVVL